MAFEGLLNKIRLAKANIIKNRESELLRISLDQLALIKLRIQTSGNDYKNAKFPPYTPAYAKERKRAGYQAGYVDFTRTGRFWAGVRPKVEKSDIFSTTITVGSEDARGKNILKGAEKKRGNILTPSREEIDFVRKANIKRVVKYLNF
jgi:hypothetical protein